MARWMFLALLGVMGCDDGVTDSDPGTDSGTETDSGSETETEDDGLARISGKVTDADGKGVQVRINVCKDSCFTEFTGEDGSYSFRAHFPPGDYWFYTVNTSSDGPLSNMSVSIHIAEDDYEITQNVMLPLIGATSQLPASAKEVELASGLFAHVGLDKLKLLDTEDTRTGAVLVDPKYFPEVAYPGTVVAAWYLLPFEAEVLEGKKVPVRIVPGWGAKDGDSFDVYRGMYTWEKVGTYSVSNGEINIENIHYFASIFVVESK